MRSPDTSRSGFTLVEVLVVLAILAGLVAIAYPAFEKLYARMRISYERDDLERQLRELPQKAYLAGRDSVLADPSAEEAAAAADRAPDPADRQALRLNLPKGWSMSVPKPIIYHFTGACDGGEVLFSLPPYSLHYVLTAPLCRPLPADAPRS